MAVHHHEVLFTSAGFSGKAHSAPITEPSLQHGLLDVNLDDSFSSYHSPTTVSPQYVDTRKMLVGSPTLLILVILSSPASMPTRKGFKDKPRKPRLDHILEHPRGC